MCSQEFDFATFGLLNPGENGCFYSYATQRLRLPLGLEARIMTPNGVSFLFFSFLFFSFLFFSFLFFSFLFFSFLFLLSNSASSKAKQHKTDNKSSIYFRV